MSSTALHAVPRDIPCEARENAREAHRLANVSQKLICLLEEMASDMKALGHEKRGAVYLKRAVDIIETKVER